MLLYKFLFLFFEMVNRLVLFGDNIFPQFVFRIPYKVLFKFSRAQAPPRPVGARRHPRLSRHITGG